MKARAVDLEDRILREFGARARRTGPSAVVMADLARDLGISTKTLYRVFPTKAVLVHRLLERWAARLQVDFDASAPQEPAPFADQLLSISTVWQEHRRRFSGAFWDEVERDYPESYALWTQARSTFRTRILDRLGPMMRPGVPPELAMELFDAGLARAMDPSVQSQAGVTARAAIQSAVSVWASGALSEPLRARDRGRRRATLSSSEDPDAGRPSSPARRRLEQ